MNSSLSLPSFISGSVIAWIIFILALVIWFGISAVLLYHWRTYGLKNKMIAFAETSYLVVSLGIIICTFISLLLI